jgi:hypothetical protein
MNRFGKYLLLLLALGCSFKEAAGSPEDSFLKWFFREYVKGERVRVSPYRAYITEHDIKGTSLKDILDERRGDDSAVFFICATPVTYRSSTLELLRQLDPEADTAFIMSQIRDRRLVSWDRKYMRRLTGVKIVSRLQDASWHRPLVLYHLKSIFQYRYVTYISTPIFTLDKRYVIIQRSSNYAIGDAKKASGIFLFKRDKDQWDLIAKVDQV